MNGLRTIRVGNGFDVHKFAEGRELWLCGVRVDHTLGLLGHSDADVAIHALCDALLEQRLCATSDIIFRIPTLHIPEPTHAYCCDG